MFSNAGTTLKLWREGRTDERRLWGKRWNMHLRSNPTVPPLFTPTKLLTRSLCPNYAHLPPCLRQSSSPHQSNLFQECWKRIWGGKLGQSCIFWGWITIVSHVNYHVEADITLDAPPSIEGGGRGPLELSPMMAKYELMISIFITWSIVWEDF